MPSSRKDPARKGKVQKYKESKQPKNQVMNQTPQAPAVREVPVWGSKQEMSVNGLEFEAIFNFINSVNGAYAATQSIMQRNILQGNVKLRFEKLNEAGTEYVPMTPEEEAPHIAEFNQMLEVVRAKKDGRQPSAEIAFSESPDAVEEAKEAATSAKIVGLNGEVLTTQ